MIRIVFFMGLCSAIACAPSSQREVQATTDSCRSFTQSFYGWYATAIRTDHQHVGSLALERRASSFDSALARALRADLDASAKEPDMVVGLDFDPILASQDPDERYVVRDVSVQNDHCRAEVYAASTQSEKRNGPDVIPELVFRDGQWRFVNFHYRPADANGKANLIDELAMLRNARDRDSSKAR